MAKKTPDLDDLALPKDAPQSPSVAPAGAGKGYSHTLSFRLTSDGYRRLRRFVAEQEAQSGKRTTHQAVIEEALDDYLNKHEC